ncbi:MAG: 50S ribosomal protein L4 [Candidatus Izemoplasmataceae bacterium]
MPKVTVLNQTGTNVEEISIANTVFGIEPNQEALYNVVKAQRAAQRQGTHKTKTRSERRGGGRKPWRQKGTGRARQGSIRSPQWVGGGVVFGPTPRNYTLSVNRKVRRLALKSALSLKVQEEKFVVLDGLTLETAKTKGMVEVLNNLKLEGRTLIVLNELIPEVERAARNIPGVEVKTVSSASVYDILIADTLLATQDAVKNYEEVLA